MKIKFIAEFILALFIVSLLSFSCNDTTKPKDDNNNNGDGPSITSVNPNSTYAGYPITIIGDKFGFSKDDGYVEINGKTAVKYLYWSYTTIIAVLPADATTGKITVVVGDKTSNGVDLTINSPSTNAAPIIKGFDTNKPFPRKIFGIEGSNFGDGQNNNYVTINGVIAEVYTSWKNMKIVVEVPTGATSGDVIVYVNGQMSNAMNLEIQTDVLLLEQSLVPGGKFNMGANDEALGFNLPVHEVIITKPFYMTKYEISQAMWDEISTIEDNSYNIGEDNPVERVSWLNCCKFCNTLSIREGFKPVYTITGEEVTANWEANGYRLPTEAEWEWAARAGSDWRYGKGQDGNKGIVNNLSWHNENSGNSTHPIGQKEPNFFGLYDMLGNVKEWCWDWFDGEYYYETNNNIDPKGPSEDKDGGKSLRGGSYTEDKLKTTCSYRWGEQHTRESEYYIGFRVARNAR